MRLTEVEDNDVTKQNKDQQRNEMEKDIDIQKGKEIDKNTDQEKDVQNKKQINQQIEKQDNKQEIKIDQSNLQKEKRGQSKKKINSIYVYDQNDKDEDYQLEEDDDYDDDEEEDDDDQYKKNQGNRKRKGNMNSRGGRSRSRSRSIGLKIKNGEGDDYEQSDEHESVEKSKIKRKLKQQNIINNKSDDEDDDEEGKQLEINPAKRVQPKKRNRLGQVKSSKESNQKQMNKDQTSSPEPSSSSSSSNNLNPEQLQPIHFEPSNIDNNPAASAVNKLPRTIKCTIAYSMNELISKMSELNPQNSQSPSPSQHPQQQQQQQPSSRFKYDGDPFLDSFGSIPNEMNDDEIDEENELNEEMNDKDLKDTQQIIGKKDGFNQSQLSSSISSSMSFPTFTSFPSFSQQPQKQDNSSQLTSPSSSTQSQQNNQINLQQQSLKYEKQTPHLLKDDQDTNINLSIKQEQQEQNTDISKDDSNKEIKIKEEIYQLHLPKQQNYLQQSQSSQPSQQNNPIQTSIPNFMTNILPIKNFVGISQQEQMQIKKDDGDDDQLQTFGKPQQNIGVDQNINNSLIVNDQADIKENQINDNSNISNDFTLPIPTNTKFSLIKHGIPKQLHFLFSRYCSLCLQWADDAVVTPCQPQQHVFCRKCLHQYYEDAFEAKSTKITELKEKVINKLYGEGNGDEDEMDQQIGKKEKNKSNQQKKRGKNAKINKRIDEELIKAQEEMKILRCPVCGNQITKICGVSLKVLQCAHILASDVRGKKLLGLDPDGDEIDNEVEDEEDNNNKDKEKEKNTKLGNVIVKENKIIEKDNDNTKDNKIVKNDEETKPTTEIVKQKKTHIVREWITSTKMLSLAEYITNMPKGEKIVVFSQWTTCLDIIEGVMHHIGCKFCRFDGEQSFTVQQTNLKQFSSPKGNVRVLLASLKAGGVGLNLYAANHVILIDKWWNPFVEEQAIDRVHRIGQTKPVSVIRLKCIQSIEERIEALQEKKMIKAEDVLQDERNEFRDASIGDGDAEQDKMAAKLGKSLTLNDYGFLIGGRSLGRPSTFNSRQQRPQAAQQNVSIPSFNAYPYAVNIPQQRPSPQPLYNQNIPLNAQSDQMQFPSFNFY